MTSPCGADIDIPDRKFKMTMLFRSDTDTSLAASLTVELTFILVIVGNSIRLASEVESGDALG